MQEWWWPGLRGRVASIEATAAARVDEGLPLRSRHRLPTVKSRGSLSGRAVLVPTSVALLFVVAVAVLVGVAGAAVGVSGVPFGGLVGVLAFFIADRWYVLGARRLGLLPERATETGR